MFLALDISKRLTFNHGNGEHVVVLLATLLNRSIGCGAGAV